MCGHGAVVVGTGPLHSSGRAQGAGEPHRSRRSPAGNPAPLASPVACNSGAAPGSTQHRGQQSQGGWVRVGCRAGPQRGGGHPGAQGQGAGRCWDHLLATCCAGVVPVGCSPQRTGGGRQRAAGLLRRCLVVGSCRPPGPGCSPPVHCGWASVVAAACFPGTSASGPWLLAPPAQGTRAL